MAIEISTVPTRAFAFSPSKITIKGATAGQQIDFTFNGFSATRYADSTGNLIFPLAKALKSAWATTDVGDVIPESAGNANSETKLVKTVTLGIKNSSGTDLFASPYTISAIWGALQVAETEDTEETIYRFGSLPLSVIQNIGSDTWVNTSGAAGNLFGKDFFLAENYNKIEFKTGSTVHKTITVQDLEYCENDVYLRWVHRQGQYKYFAFRLGASKDNSKAGDLFNKELTDLSATTDGLYKSQTQLINIEGVPVQSLSLPTATYEMQRFIKSLETSVKCWKYLGSNQWVEVTAAVKPIVLDERFQSNQSIELEITLPQLYLQSL